MPARTRSAAARRHACYAVSPERLPPQSCARWRCSSRARAGELVDALRARMKAAAQALRFEEAARLRDQLFAIERSLERQKIATTETIDQDVFGLPPRGGPAADLRALRPAGPAQRRTGVPVHRPGVPRRRAARQLREPLLRRGQLRPRRGAAPAAAGGRAARRWPSCSPRSAGGGCACSCPSAARSSELVEMARRTPSRRFSDAAPEPGRDGGGPRAARRTRSHLAALPRRMECFDISHFQGASIVAAQVAMTDGELDRARYRRFRIKRVQAQDDFASHVRGGHPPAAARAGGRPTCPTCW